VENKDECMFQIEKEIYAIKEKLLYLGIESLKENSKLKFCCCDEKLSNFSNKETSSSKFKYIPLNQILYGPPGDWKNL
jgi:hypothetical protein